LAVHYNDVIYVFFHFDQYYQLGRCPVGFLRFPETGIHRMAQSPLGRRRFFHSDRFSSSLPGCPEEKGENPGGGPRDSPPFLFEPMLLLPARL